MAPRKHLTIRISDDGYARLNELRDQHTVSFSDAVRACLAVALKHPAEVNQVLATLKETQ